MTSLGDAQKHLERVGVLHDKGLQTKQQLEASQANFTRLKAGDVITKVITQTATTITARDLSGSGDHVATYHLDGAESKNTVASTGAVTSAKTAWDGNRLVITQTSSDGKTAQIQLVWTLDQLGRLVVEKRALNPTTGQTQSLQVGLYRKK